MSSGSTTAEHASGKMQKRQVPRKSIESLVYADLGPGNGGFPIDVSEEGMAFQGIQPLAKNDLIHVKFKLPDSQAVVDSDAQVVWMNELGKGGGLQFIDLAEESRRQINRWVSLQTNPENLDGNTSGEPVKTEVKETPRTESTLTAARGDEVPSNASSKPVVTSLPLLSVHASEIAAGAKPMPQFLPSGNTSECASQESQKKREWLVPSAIGLAASLVVVTVIMIISGVISVQVHWPEEGTAEIAAAPVSAPAASTASEIPNAMTPETKSSGRSAAILSPTNTPFVPERAPSAQRLAPPAPSEAGTKAPVSVVPPRASLEQFAAAKLKPLNPVQSTTVTDLAPPPPTLDTRPESTPQLPTISSPAPAVPVSAPTRNNAAVEPAQLIVRKDPVYPADAKASGISGSVELHYKITTEGDVHDIKVLKGNFLLVRGAIEALQSWRYQPAKLNGAPVESESDAVFTFKPN